MATGKSYFYKVLLPLFLFSILVFLISDQTNIASVSGPNSDQQGGTLRILTRSDQIEYLDPQRIIASEDQAFASSYLIRTLTQYLPDPDSKNSPKLVGDLATDVGKTFDEGKSWQFTLRDGVKWEDGKLVTCEDIKYGISRIFATELITGGRDYPIKMLDIPRNLSGDPIFRGPYIDDPVGQAAYDNAVFCEGNKITFKLISPVVDFNHTVTLSAFAPVRKDADTGEKYTDLPLSNGPYKIESYVKKDKLVLVRNENWDPATDSVRPALPDRIEYFFSVPVTVITERLMSDVGDDQFAISVDSIDPNKLATIFSDSKYEKRRFNQLDPFVRFFFINTKVIPNEKHRQAILAAVNREDLRNIAGGEFSGDYADGIISPTIGEDYAPTGLWDGLLGDVIPAKGNLDFAKRLLEQSGEPFPLNIKIDYLETEVNTRAVASIVSSLESIGVTAIPNGLTSEDYLQTVFNETLQGGLTYFSWSSDWSNASTVIPELFSPNGVAPLTRYEDPNWLEQLNKANTMFRREDQAKEWQYLNSDAVRKGLILPIRFSRDQRLVGSRVIGAYIWGPYGTWPYANLGVRTVEQVK